MSRGERIGEESGTQEHLIHIKVEREGYAAAGGAGDARLALLTVDDHAERIFGPRNLIFTAGSIDPVGSFLVGDLLEAPLLFEPFLELAQDLRVAGMNFFASFSGYLTRYSIG